MNICIGIISWLPQEEEIRKVRLQRLKRLINQCNELMNLPILIIAQNWRGDEISGNNITIYHYSKLGITGARETLRKKFLNSSYDWILCLDDDFELFNSKSNFTNWLSLTNNHPNSFITCGNYLMNLCLVSKYIFEKYPFDINISAETGTGFEDWIYCERIKKVDPTHYYNEWRTGLAAKLRKELVEDKYSTWITKNVNKDEITRKSRQIIDSY